MGHCASVHRTQPATVHDKPSPVRHPIQASNDLRPPTPAGADRGLPTIPSTDTQKYNGIDITTSSVALTAAAQTALASLELEAKASPLDALQADDSSALSKWLCGGIESIGRRGSSAAVAPTPRDPNVNIITKDGGMGEERLLLVAVRLNAGKCVSYLVQAGADVNFAGMNGYTALHVAAGDGLVDICRTLLAAGANANAATTACSGLRIASKQTPFHRAAAAAAMGKPNGPATLALIAGNGGDPEARDSVGDTPYDVFAQLWSPPLSPTTARLARSASAMSVMNSEPDEARYKAWLACFPSPESGRASAWLGARSSNCEHFFPTCDSSTPSPTASPILPVLASPPVALKTTRPSFSATMPSPRTRYSLPPSPSPARAVVLSAVSWHKLAADVRGLVAKERMDPLSASSTPAHLTDAGNNKRQAAGPLSLGSDVSNVSSDLPTESPYTMDLDAIRNQLAAPIVLDAPPVSETLDLRRRPKKGPAGLGLKSLNTEIAGLVAPSTMRGGGGRRMFAGDVSEKQFVSAPQSTGGVSGPTSADSDVQLGSVPPSRASAVSAPSAMYEVPALGSDVATPAPPPPYFGPTFASQCRLVIWDFDLTLLRIHSHSARIKADAVPRRSMQRDFYDLSFFGNLVSELLAANIAVAIASFGHYDVIQAFMDCALINFAVIRPVTGRKTRTSSISPSNAVVALATPELWPGSVNVGAVVSLPSLQAPPSPTAAAAAMPTQEPPQKTGKQNWFGRVNICTPSLVGGVDGSGLTSGKIRQLEYVCTTLGGVPKDQILFFDDDPRNIDGALDAGYSRCVHTPDGFSRDTWADTMKLYT